MEFPEAAVRILIHNHNNKGKGNGGEKQNDKWKISFHRPSTSSSEKLSGPKNKTHKEFLCPISGSLMNDPVVVSSGHSFEKACVQACIAIGFVPVLDDGSKPDFSTVIPNRALKSAILNWCKDQRINPPNPLDLLSAENLVRTKMETQWEKQNSGKKNRNDQDLINGVRENHSSGMGGTVSNISNLSTYRHLYSSSDDSVGSDLSTTPLQLTTRPSCCSSASSSELEMQNPNPSPKEEELVTKLKSPQVLDVEEALISLRKITRTKYETRLQLCSPLLLATLRPLILSPYTNIQVNSVACLVNLSLEKLNKIKMVRSGFLPWLIDVLKRGFPEAQEHAAAAIFSLSLDDNNKTAIGVLGALSPLLRLLKSESERTRHDSALALYHLSLVRSNRAKLVKLGSVPILMNMVKSGHMRSQVLLILCKMARCSDGRAAMLDSGGVECVVGILRESQSESESTRESCVSVLYGLSDGGLRFKGLAKTAGVAEVLLQAQQTGSKRWKVMVKRILEIMKDKVEEDEEVDWEELLGLGSTSGKADDTASHVNSSEF